MVSAGSIFRLSVLNKKKVCLLNLGNAGLKVALLRGLSGGLPGASNTAGLCAANRESSVHRSHWGASQAKLHPPRILKGARQC